MPDAVGRISLGSTILKPAIASWRGIRRVPGVPLSCVDEYMYASEPLSEWWFDKVKDDARFGEDREDTSIFRPDGTRNSSKACEEAVMLEYMLSSFHLVAWKKHFWRYSMYVYMFENTTSRGENAGELVVHGCRTRTGSNSTKVVQISNEDVNVGKSRSKKLNLFGGG